MGSSYKVSIYPQEVALISFAGVLDSTVMSRAFNDCYQRNCYSLIIDMANTDQAPNSALEIFPKMAKTALKEGGRLVFVRVDGPVQIILDMMGIPEKFRFYDSQSVAVKDVIESRMPIRRVQL